MSKSRKNKEPKMPGRRFRLFTRILAIIYLLSLVVFEIALIVLNFLPSKILIAIFLILGAISIIIFALLYFKKVKKVPKIIATVLSIMMIFVFGVGTSYAMGTVGFLDKITAKGSDYAVSVTEKPFNIYISGMDYRGDIDATKGRSDVNMIVTVNPKTHRILLTSFPRDYEIRLVDHGYATDKLTHTGLYGVKTGESSLTDLTGIKINYYVKVNFTTIQEFIDAIGGVTVNSDVEFTAEVWGTGNDDSIVGKHHFVKGKNKLDGQTALAFARERYAFEGGDNQRIKNQQAVFQAILEKVTSSTTILTRYNKILNAVGDYMRTDMTEDEITSIVKKQINDGMPEWHIEKYDVTGFDSYQTTYSGGSTELYVMSPDEDSVQTAAANIKTVMRDGYSSKNKSPIEGTITVKKHYKEKSNN